MKLKEIIEYRNKFPFYKGMPCFVNGMRLNSTPKINEEGFLSAYYWRDGGLWDTMPSRYIQMFIAFLMSVYIYLI